MRRGRGRLVFVPDVSEMYPSWPAPPATAVTVRGVSERWEGASRPGHFDGVATVVAKLFAVAGPCRAYFGEKDFQQLAVVRRIAADLCLPVEVVGCAIVREPDGLALSSRNVRLSNAERDAAIVLRRALAAGQALSPRGRVRGAWPRAMAAAAGRRAAGRARLRRGGRRRRARACTTLTDPADVRLLVAARVGPVRLIDNCPAVERRAETRRRRRPRPRRRPAAANPPTREDRLSRCDAA